MITDLNCVCSHSIYEFVIFIFFTHLLHIGPSEGAQANLFLRFYILDVWIIKHLKAKKYTVNKRDLTWLQVCYINDAVSHCFIKVICYDLEQSRENPAHKEYLDPGDLREGSSFVILNENRRGK